MHTQRGLALCTLVIFASTMCRLSAAQHEKKPLTNADVVSMVKAGLAESTIVLAIQHSPADFDTSSSALIALKNEGVTQKILDAMLTMGTAKTSAPGEPAAKSGKTEEGEEAKSKWLVTEEVSPIDSSRTVALLLPAEQGIPGTIGNVRPDLVIRCLGHKTELYIATQTILPVDLDSTGEYPVRLRLDDGQPFTENWGESTSHDSLFAPTPGRFARQLAASSKLAVEFSPADSAPVATWFDLSGLNNLLDKVANACGWSVQGGPPDGGTQDLHNVRNVFVQGDKHEASFMQTHLEKHTCLHVVSDLAEADAILDVAGTDTKLVGKDGDILWQQTGIRFYGPLNTAVGCPH